MIGSAKTGSAPAGEVGLAVEQTGGSDGISSCRTGP